MRELKFRVWSERQKTYDYKFPYNYMGDFYVSTGGKLFSDFGNSVAPEVKQDDFIIEQYTGLKDKNGKEIYVGDILLDGIGEPCEPWIVKFDDGKFIGGIQGVVEDLFELTDLEIIGNIHENADLLGEK